MSTPRGGRVLRAAPVTALLLAALLALPALSYAAGQPKPLEVAQRKAINPGLGPAPEDLDRSTPAATWRSFLSLGAKGAFPAAAHCLDLSEVPTDRQFDAGLRTAERLYKVLKALGAREDTVRADTPEGPMVDGTPLNYVVAIRFNRRGMRGEIWLRRTVASGSGEMVWLFTRRTVSSVALWYRVLVRHEKIQSGPLDMGLGAVPPDVNRSTPRDTAKGYQEACRHGDYRRAAFYFDLNAIPEAQQAEAGPRLARRLRIVLERTTWVDPENLSNDPGGLPEPGLGDDDELLTTIELKKTKVRILLHRHFFPDGSWAWVFSRSTVAAIDPLYAQYGFGWLGDRLPAVFFNVVVAGVALWQWTGLAIFLLLAWFVSLIVTPRLLAILRRGARKTRAKWDDELVAALDGPARLGVIATVLFLTVPWLGLEGPAATTVGVIWKLLALLFLGWVLSRWVDIAMSILAKGAAARKNEMARNFLPIFGRILKIGVWAICIVAVLDSVGIRVMGLVAGLGIGGVAIAFAAQKTIENLFGSLAIAVDRPFQIGDFVRLGDHEGTVTEVGLRSTRIQTMDRTIISIPNGTLLSERIENYSARDRYRYRPTIGLLYGTSRAQLELVIDEIKKLLERHPRVYHDGVRVRFARFGDSALEIDIQTWILAQGYHEFTAVAEELNFEILAIVERSGSGFAFPSQTVYMARESGIDPDLAKQAEQEAKRRRQQGDLWIPEPPEATRT